jgi:hypothetical protein
MFYKVFYVAKIHPYVKGQISTMVSSAVTGMANAIKETYYVSLKENLLQLESIIPINQITEQDVLAHIMGQELDNTFLDNLSSLEKAIPLLQGKTLKQLDEMCKQKEIQQETDEEAQTVKVTTGAKDVANLLYKRFYDSKTDEPKKKKAVKIKEFPPITEDVEGEEETKKETRKRRSTDIYSPPDTDNRKKVARKTSSSSSATSRVVKHKETLPPVVPAAAAAAAAAAAKSSLPHRGSLSSSSSQQDRDKPIQQTEMGKINIPATILSMQQYREKQSGSTPSKPTLSASKIEAENERSRLSALQMLTSRTRSTMESTEEPEPVIIDLNE